MSWVLDLLISIFKRTKADILLVLMLLYSLYEIRVILMMDLLSWINWKISILAFLVMRRTNFFYNFRCSKSSDFQDKYQIEFMIFQK